MESRVQAAHAGDAQPYDAAKILSKCFADTVTCTLSGLALLAGIGPRTRKRCWAANAGGLPERSGCQLTLDSHGQRRGVHTLNMATLKKYKKEEKERQRGCFQSVRFDSAYVPHARYPSSYFAKAG